MHYYHHNYPKYNKKHDFELFSHSKGFVRVLHTVETTFIKIAYFSKMDGKELLEMLHFLDMDRLCIKEIDNQDTMKLFVCVKCSDIVKCTYEERSCECGESTGKYLKNGADAVFTGKHCVPLGIANGAFIKALQMAEIENKYQKEPTTCQGVDFKSFVILDCSTTIHHKK